MSLIRASRIHDELFAAYGPQDWWPAEDAFEIMVGALLVQRTSWANTEVAIANLRDAQLLSPRSLATAELADIECCVRPAGFFRSKAVRLRALGEFLVTRRSIAGLRTESTPDLRRILMALEGIGPETADAILLYAFGRPAAVIDEYLRRLVRRLLGPGTLMDDAGLRAWVDGDVMDAPRLNELHALVVAHGKLICQRRPKCAECALRSRCLTGSADSDTELGERVGDFAQNS